MATKSEKEWRAEMDARSLADALAVTGDSARLKSAQVAAKRLVKDDQKRAKEVQKSAQSMQAVAKNSYSREFKKAHGGKKK